MSDEIQLPPPPETPPPSGTPPPPENPPPENPPPEEPSPEPPQDQPVGSLKRRRPRLPYKAIIRFFVLSVGIGAIIGPLVGGLVVALFGWRSIVFLGLPFGAAT